VSLRVADDDGKVDTKTLNVVVGRGATSITTTASPDTVLGAGALIDRAMVSGRVNPGAATVGFSLYGPGDATCSGPPLLRTPNMAYPVAGGTVTSAAFTPTQPGTYRWIASYSGDANNLPSAGTCDDATQATVVAVAAPTIATTASAGIVLGAGTLSDSATVSGRINPLEGATIAFRLYGPGDQTCTGAPVYESPNVAYPVAGGAVTSAAFTPTQAGTYRWIASYSGDVNNLARAGACNDAGEATVVAARTDAAAPPDADRDGDGVADTSDSCASFAGNLLNGCPRRLDADVRVEWRLNELYSQLLSLTVRAPTGSRIVLRCKGRKGVCGFRTRTIAKTTEQRTSLTRTFRGARIFPARTSIILRVTKPLHHGTYQRLLTRNGRRLPRVIGRCLNAAAMVQRCP